MLESFLLKGLDHCITAPIGTHKCLINDDHGITFSRSMTEKLDRLSEREKVDVKTICIRCTFLYVYLFVFSFNGM